MSVQARIRDARQRHLIWLKEMGYGPLTMGKINSLERRMHKYAELYANGDISEIRLDQELARTRNQIAEMFGGAAPDGFFVNLDPRGYALKINDDAMRDYADRWAVLNPHRDWGGYGILSPEFN